MGQAEESVSLSNIRASRNPIIKSMVDRFNLQQAMRNASAYTFLGGIKVGLFFTTLLITAERTVFYRPLAFDILKKSVNDIQSNNFG